MPMSSARERTGDETYVLNLLRELAPLAPAAGLRIAAVTRKPELVPEGVEAVEARDVVPGTAHVRDAAAAAPRASAPRSRISSTRCRSHCPARRVVTIHDSLRARASLMTSKGPARLQAGGAARGAEGGAC
jgi:hypothetical protein